MTSLFSKINNWNDFNSALIPLNKKEKGDAFELLSKLYFLIDKYDNYDNIWLLSDVPKKELEIIGIESRDLGIDLIAKKGKVLFLVQVALSFFGVCFYNIHLHEAFATRYTLSLITWSC